MRVTLLLIPLNAAEKIKLCIFPPYTYYHSCNARSLNKVTIWGSNIPYYAKAVCTIITAGLARWGIGSMLYEKSCRWLNVYWLYGLASRNSGSYVGVLVLFRKRVAGVTKITSGSSMTSSGSCKSIFFLFIILILNQSILIKPWESISQITNNYYIHISN